MLHVRPISLYILHLYKLLSNRVKQSAFGISWILRMPHTETHLPNVNSDQFYSVDYVEQSWLNLSCIHIFILGRRWEFGTANKQWQWQPKCSVKLAALYTHAYILLISFVLFSFFFGHFSLQLKINWKVRLVQYSAVAEKSVSLTCYFLFRHVHRCVNPCYYLFLCLPSSWFFLLLHFEKIRLFVCGLLGTQSSHVHLAELLCSLVLGQAMLIMSAN